VSSAASGDLRVQVDRAAGTVETVGVTIGLSADGFVEVIAADRSSLNRGDRVVIG